MDNEMEVVMEETAEVQIPVKRGGKPKKDAAPVVEPEDEVVKNDVPVENPAAKADTKTPKVRKRKQYDLHDLVDVRNMTPGKLVYKSSRNAGYMVEWDTYGDEQSIEISELKNMLASQRTFFERNWIWVDDPELLEFLGASRYYKNMLSPDAVEDLFELDADELIAKIKTLTKDMQNTIRVIAREKVLAGDLESYAVVQALQKYFHVTFDEE